MSEHLNESLKAAEAECAEGRTAPRISLGKIEDQIEEVRYSSGTDLGLFNMGHLTVCAIKCKNGFVILGDSCPMSVENYDPALGQKLAYEKAIRQLWPLMAFAAKDKAYA